MESTKTPPRPDTFGRDWPELPDFELCAKCGQPDNCGDCNHKPYTDDEVKQLKGEIERGEGW